MKIPYRKDIRRMPFEKLIKKIKYIFLKICRFLKVIFVILYNYFSRNKKKIKLFLKKFFILICCFLIIISFLFILIFIDRYLQLPEIDYTQLKTSPSTIVLDKDDKEISNLSDNSVVMIENISQIPQSLIEALVSAEDSRFYTHRGIDGPRTLKAFLGTYILKRGDSGGSTITQQLAKQTIFSKRIAQDPHYKYSEKRKIDEWLAAALIERNISKEDILIAYLNNAVSYGRYTGAGTAAKVFFNKEISKITIPEAVLLAGIPQLPRKNNPYYDIKNATSRYIEVLTLMKHHKYITEDEFEQYKNIPLSELVLKKICEIEDSNRSYFNAIENELKDIFKENKTEIGNTSSPFYYRNYKIYTALDTEKQNLADKIMNTNIYVNWKKAVQNIYGKNYTDEDNNNFQGAFTVVNVKNGEIPSVGVARNIDEIGLNIAFDSYRSPGSCIKPIIDYVPLIEKYKWSSDHYIYDKTCYYTGTNIEVQNYNGKKKTGKTILKKAIADSINTTAVQSMQYCGVEFCGEIANRLGITQSKKLLKEKLLTESSSLGGGIETSTKELAGAYSALANNGLYIRPHIIKKIEDINTKEIVWDFNEQNKPLQAISPSTASTITDALIYSRKYGTFAASSRKQVNNNISFGAKTGTSSYSQEQYIKYNMNEDSERDHWHVGYSPEYSIACWTGMVIENEEVLKKTNGNSVLNKDLGSYVVSTWINKFASNKKKFDFTKNSYNDIKSGIDEFQLKIDNKKNILSWNIPKINYPINFSEIEKISSGNLIYNIIFNIDGKVYNIETKNTTISIPSEKFNNGVVMVTASLDTNFGKENICSNIQCRDLIKNN